MRLYCSLMLLMVRVTTLWGQNEPCLAGADTPECGIKVTVNPPLSPTENILWVPNEITIDVPQRLHAARVVLLSGPTGTAAAEAFKPLAEAKNYKKVDGNARFKIPVKDCPGSDTALEVGIYSQRFPYPLTLNIQPFQCKQGSPK